MSNNRLVRFIKRPAGKPTPDIFEIDEEPLRELGPGEFLARNCYLSMDPALVGRMRDESNYAGQVNPGDTMQAYGISQVIASRNSKVKVGTVLLGLCGMQQYIISDDSDGFSKINLGLADATAYLSAVGITGATAYFGLLDIGKPRAGETLLISAGASSVGSITAQIGKSLGLRTVAIVSSDDKAEQVKRDWGYDAAVSYRGKSIEQLSADLAEACPHGVDIYYDNTSGDISEAVLDHFNDHARHVVIGRLGISHLNNTRDDTGRRDNNTILAKRIRKQGMVLLDYKPKMRAAVLQLAKWLRQGDIQVQQDVLEGIDRCPEAFFRMLSGDSQGKQLVKLADINPAADPTPLWPGRLLTQRWFPTDKLAQLLAR
ncbi:NADP-dependent oxidoreductase [Spongiibacter sp.]|uniref:NADP-dependent oxidoreductase n=1 Tax=Spongiibacter sp. TaxID=2024860 RepID=UPI0035636723